jgi:hypothetical protein
MAKYQVTAIETVKYLIEVEADSADEAEKLAAEMWNQSADPDAEFSAEGYGIEVTHVYLNGRPQPELG